MLWHKTLDKCWKLDVVLVWVSSQADPILGFKCKTFIWEVIPGSTSRGGERRDRQGRKPIKGAFMRGLLLGRGKGRSWGLYHQLLVEGYWERGCCSFEALLD